MKKRILITTLLLLVLTGCKSKTYTVTFMDEDKLLDSVVIKKGDTISKIDKPTKDGYIFVTWLKDGIEYDNNNEVNSDITLMASWTKEPVIKKNYTVTFNYGTEIKTQTITEGEKATKPEHDPKKEKHIFLGWYVGETLYDFDSPVTKDIVLLAKFKKDRVVINYELDGGTGLVQVEIDRGTIPEKPENPSKFGYDFLNWTLDGQAYNFDFPINDDVTIKAVYTPTEYVKVTFDTDGGNKLQNQMIAKNTTLKTLPIPEKFGYKFKYWSYDNQEFQINQKIDKDITLIAIYEENN